MMDSEELLSLLHYTNTISTIEPYSSLKNPVPRKLQFDDGQVASEDRYDLI